jgi:hypothetical protein
LDPLFSLHQVRAFKKSFITRCQWLKPVIPATQEAEIRKIVVPSQPWQIVQETHLENTYHKKWLVEWLKV